MIAASHAIMCSVYLLCFFFLFATPSIFAQKLKFCTVDGRGGFKKAGRYCPKLEEKGSQVECVIGVDRMDCLRKIWKGQADFAVFTAEDLVVAANAAMDFLVTNELRYTEDDFEYEVVAVVSNKANIKSKFDLHEKKLCHPGYGYENDWTRILANFLENSVATQNCYLNLTMTENRILSASTFFKKACKAGPWVNDPLLDYTLKSKYSNLCDLCGSPSTCSVKDKYWGRRGPLYCLTDGIGDVSWSRLDDVQSHFGIDVKHRLADPSDYSLLCKDDTTMPVNSTKPCVWVVRPWPIVASRRSTAERVQEVINSLKHNEVEEWRSSLLDLIETYHIKMHAIKPIQSLDGFLQRATGFLSANSFSGCHPPRTIKVCTTSILENAKCGWIRDAAASYGIEPDIDCVRALNKTQCMEAVNNKAADIVMVNPDQLKTAIIDYNLHTLFYETVNDEDKYITVAVIRKDSDIKTFKDLEGRKACFPIYDGIAYNSVIHKLKENNLLEKCPFAEGMAEFFGPSCVPDLPQNYPKKLKETCKENNAYHGEFGALDCLNEETGEVAFVSLNSMKKYITDVTMNRKLLHEFKVLCDNGNSNPNNEECHLSWSPIGQGMTLKNQTDLWYIDALDVFKQLDNMYGKNYKTVTRPVSLFDLFNSKSDVLFHDATVKLHSSPKVKNFDPMSKEYDTILKTSLKECKAMNSASINSSLNYGTLIFIILCHLLKRTP